MNEADLSRKVISWVRYADEDLALARHSMKMRRDRPFRLIAFHAQQCAEKYLKAVLVFHRRDFQYTHNIGYLLEACGPHVGWGEALSEAEELTPFAVSVRYPGEDEEVTGEEASRAIELAELVKRSVLAHLNRLGAFDSVPVDKMDGEDS